MKKLKKENKGFSLAELIVVVLILGILAVAVTPQIMNWVNKSKIGKDEMYAGTVATAAESVALEHLGKGTLGTSTLTYDVTDNAVTATNGSDATIGAEIKEMIGAAKCKAPTQSNKTKYEIKIVPSADGKTVDVTCTAQ